MTDTIVIYHGGCRDGFCAAWVINKYFKNKFHSSDLEIQEQVTYHPGFYGQEPPDCKGKDVIIVDFCYPLDKMQQIFDSSKSVIWLDHHKTAQPIADYLNQYRTSYFDVKYVFDNERSGAGIAWDYLFGGKERPWLVDYVEDRDLWAKKLPNSNEVNAYIACLEFNFSIWNLIDSINVIRAVERGGIALAKTEQYIREVCKNVYFKDILGHPRDESFKLPAIYKEFKNIPIVNISQVDCSEVMEHLLKLYPDSPFSLYWFKRADGMYQYGLRSIGDFDVSIVAKLFGGGGHKNAAGFQLGYLLEELK